MGIIGSHVDLYLLAAGTSSKTAVGSGIRLIVRAIRRLSRTGISTVSGAMGISRQLSLGRTAALRQNVRSSLREGGISLTTRIGPTSGWATTRALSEKLRFYGQGLSERVSGRRTGSTFAPMALRCLGWTDSCGSQVAEAWLPSTDSVD